MTRKEKIKRLFNVLWKILLVVGIVGVFASVLLDLFNRFNDYQNNKYSSDHIVSINRRINFSDYNYDDIVFINESSYDIEQEDMIYNFDTYNANYNFKVGYNYKLVGCVSFPVTLNSSIDLLSLNNLTWNQLLGTGVGGGTINFNNIENCFIFDFYFSGTSSLRLNVYFTINAIVTMPNSYYLLFNIGSDTRFTFNYSNIDLSLNFFQTQDRNSYQNGYDIGFTNGYNSGLEDGLTNGVNNGQEIYDNGYDIGYEAGFNDGLNENSDNILRNALLTIFDIPLMYLRSLLNFDLLGVNFFGLFCGLVTFSFVLWFVVKVI